MPNVEWLRLRPLVVSLATGFFLSPGLSLAAISSADNATVTSRLAADAPNCGTVSSQVSQVLSTPVGQGWTGDNPIEWDRAGQLVRAYGCNQGSSSVLSRLTAALDWAEPRTPVGNCDWATFNCWWIDRGINGWLGPAMLFGGAQLPSSVKTRMNNDYAQFWNRARQSESGADAIGAAFDNLYGALYFADQNRLQVAINLANASTSADYGGKIVDDWSYFYHWDKLGNHYGSSNARDTAYYIKIVRGTGLELASGAKRDFYDWIWNWGQWVTYKGYNDPLTYVAKFPYWNQGYKFQTAADHLLYVNDPAYAAWVPGLTRIRDESAEPYGAMAYPLDSYLAARRPAFFVGLKLTSLANPEWEGSSFNTNHGAANVLIPENVQEKLDGGWGSSNAELLLHPHQALGLVTTNLGFEGQLYANGNQNFSGSRPPLSTWGWYGVNTLGGYFAMAAQNLNWTLSGKQLVLQKGWFVFDDEIVATQSGTTTDSAGARTWLLSFKVNSSTIETSSGVQSLPSSGSTNLGSPTWAHTNNFGFAMLGGSAHEATALETGFARLQINHGTSFASAVALLPKASKSFTQAYGNGVSVLQLDDDAHVLRDVSSGAVGAAVWSAVDRTEIALDRPGYALLRQNGSEIRASVFNPHLENNHPAGDWANLGQGFNPKFDRYVSNPTNTSYVLKVPYSLTKSTSCTGCNAIGVTTGSRTTITFNLRVNRKLEFRAVSGQIVEVRVGLNDGDAGAPPTTLCTPGQSCTTNENCAGVCASDGMSCTDVANDNCPVTGGPDLLPPNAASNLRVTSYGDHSLALAWNAPGPASDGDLPVLYEVRRNGAVVGTSLVTSYTDQGLQPSTTYPYQVLGQDDAANLSQAASGSFATLTDQQAPIISGLATTGIGTTVATVQWTTNEAADGRVEYGLSPGSLGNTRSSSNLTTSHSLNLEGLAPGTTYYYRVLSTDGSGNQAISTTPNLTTRALSDPFNPPFPRIGVLYFYEVNVPEVIWEDKEMVIVRYWYPEIAQKIKNRFPDKLVLAANNIIDGNVINPPDAWLIPTLNGACIPGWHQSQHPGDCLYDPTDWAPLIGGKRWNQHLPQYLDDNTDWNVFDGTFWDSWAGTIKYQDQNAFGQIDFDRNGTADNSQGQGELADVYWRQGNDKIVNNMRSYVPAGKGVAVGHEASVEEKAYLNGRGFEYWKGYHWQWTFDNLLRPFAEQAVAPRVTFIEGNGNADDFAKMRFGLTTASLVDAYFYYEQQGTSHTLDYHYDEFEADLGFPLGPAQAIRPSVYVRYFDNGAVITNGSGSPQTVQSSDLTGGPYYRFRGGQVPSFNDGAQFTSVTLQGTGAPNNLGSQTGDGILLLRSPKTLITDIVVDNVARNMTSPGSSPVTYAGSWTQQLMSNLPGTTLGFALLYGWDEYGPPYAKSTQAGAIATYRPNIGVAGDYVIYEWHPNVSSDGQGSACGNITLNYSGMTCSDWDNSVNQGAGAGTFNRVGRCTLSAGTTGAVVLTSPGGCTATSDAIKFIWHENLMTPLFADGFESGNASAWSSSVP